VTSDVPRQYSFANIRVINTSRLPALYRYYRFVYWRTSKYKDEEFECVRIGYTVSRMPTKTCHNLVLLFSFIGLLVNDAFIIVHGF